MNLLVTMQAYNSILKIIYFLIIRKESKFSRLKRALKENIDDAFTVSGDSEFHTLTTLYEKKCNLESSLAVLVFNFQLCPLVCPAVSRTKN